MNCKSVSIVTFVLFMIFVCLLPDNGYALQPRMGVKGNMYPEVIEIARTLESDDTLLVWIDINATVDLNNDYWLPADPTLYGIKSNMITFDVDIDQSNLFWCLAEIPAQDAEGLMRIPWVFDMRLPAVGNQGIQVPASQKLSVGLQETIDRALPHNKKLQVIMWVVNSTASAGESSTNSKGIGEEVLYNVTTTINRFGGELLRKYHEGSRTILATLPPQNITRVVENPFIKKLYLDGPLIFLGSDNTARLYGVDRREHCIEHYLRTPLILLSLVGAISIGKSNEKSRTKLLISLCVILILSWTFMSQMIPSAQALDVSTSTIQAPDVWATGNKGGGATVAIIDTGIDLDHPDFEDAIVGRHNMEYDNTDVEDTEGHGTAVAGIVAGRGPVYRGVAPEAGLVIVKAWLNRHYEPAITWILDNTGAKVIQSSVAPTGVQRGGDGLEHEFSVELDDAVEKGKVVVQAAGNDGDLGPRSIVCPGNAFNIITVGCTDDKNSPNMVDDELWMESYCGSSSGPTEDGRPKPDVVAPGVQIMSTSLGGGYGVFGDGTSFAAPHVSGTVALMLTEEGSLTPAQVKAILRDTAKLNSNLSGLTVNQRGHGIINAKDAVDLAKDIGNIPLSQMYDGYDVETPWLWPPPYTDKDFLDFTVSAPSSTYGIAFSQVYRYKWKIESGAKHFEVFHRLCCRHVWINEEYYDLATDMNEYLLSGPRIYAKDDGWVKLRANYKVGDVTVEYDWKMAHNKVWLKLNFIGDSLWDWDALIYFDPDVWGPSNYAYLPDEDLEPGCEFTRWGDDLIDIKHEGRGEYIQIEPNATDYPRMWVLRYNYVENDPWDPTVFNRERIDGYDIIVLYFAHSEYENCGDPGPEISIKDNPPHTRNPTQDDANSGGDAPNNFNQALDIDQAGYTGILWDIDEDTDDWYKFYAESGIDINVTLSSPYGIDFDLELYDPEGNLRNASYLGPGLRDETTYSADLNGSWRARINQYSGEAEYSFTFSISSPGGGMGGCPFLHVYDGKEYMSEGLLDIHNPDGIDIVRNHTLTTKPKKVNDEYLLRLTEHPQTISHIDKVTLFAILEDKTLLELSLTSAIHSELGDVLPQLLLSDDLRTDVYGSDHNNGTSQSIDLKFQALPSTIKAVGFIFQIEGNNIEWKGEG